MPERPAQSRVPEYDRRPIALVAPLYSPSIGGIEYQVELLARGFRERGVPVEVITTDPNGAQPRTERLHGVTVRRFPTLANSSTYVVSAELGLWLSRHAGRYRLIHAHSYHTPVALTAALAARMRNVAFVMTPYYHGTGHSLLRRALHFPYRPLGWWTIRQASRVICISGSERAKVREAFGGAIPVTVIYPAVETSSLEAADPFTRAAGEVLILAVGRLEAYKHPERIVAALPFLPSRYRLIVIGRGPAQSVALETALRLGVSSRVTLMDHVARDDLERWYRTADVFATMSDHESFGLTLVEAAAGGCRVVASDIPAHREVAGLLRPDTVRLVSPDAPPELLAGELELAASDGQSRDIAAWPSASPRGLVDATLRVYEMVLGRPISQVVTSAEWSPQLPIATEAVAPSGSGPRSRSNASLP